MCTQTKTECTRLLLDFQPGWTENGRTGNRKIIVGLNWRSRAASPESRVLSCQSRAPRGFARGVEGAMYTHRNKWASIMHQIDAPRRCSTYKLHVRIAQRLEGVGQKLGQCRSKLHNNPIAREFCLQAEEILQTYIYCKHNIVAMPSSYSSEPNGSPPRQPTRR